MKHKEQWKEINSTMKPEFQRIVAVLNKYYDASQPKSTVNQASQFRKNLVRQNPESFRIYLKKFGSYEFLVHAEILAENKNSSEADTWIHIDGIQEERDQLSKQGIESHPVFQIVGLTDIYKGGTKLTRRKDLPE